MKSSAPSPICDAKLLELNPEAELARRHFRDFVSYTYPSYEWNWHQDHICQALDDLLAGGDNLMLFMPPQHGKSELVSRRFPAYALGRQPDLKIAGCSYAADLSAQFNRECQRIISSDEYREVFPETKLSDKNIRADSAGAYLRNADIFEVVGRKGSYVSTGIGGALTGKKVDLLIIDDPVKNMLEAKSPTTQRRNIDWWNTVAKTRLHNSSKVILCMTRWDELDLAGYLLQLQAQGRGLKWRVITFPAIREDDGAPVVVDPRAPGEALWPSHHSLERLQEIKESAPVVFQGMYQQNPAPPTEGQVFPGWKRIEKMPEDLVLWYGLDFGFTNDPSALVAIGLEGRRIYLQEVLYERGLTNIALAHRMKPLLQRPDSVVIADSAEPKSIEELRMHGLNARGSVKGKDSVLAGIMFLRGYEVFVVDPSPNIWVESRYYQWEPGPDGRPTNIPIDDWNHAMDAVRGAVYTKLFKPHNAYIGFAKGDFSGR